jgi:hypothetical protein
MQMPVSTENFDDPHGTVPVPATTPSPGAGHDANPERPVALIMRLRFLNGMTDTKIAERVGCPPEEVARVIRDNVVELLDEVESADN